MEPFEVLISESQERMLAIVEPDRWDAVRAVCERWGLPVAIIGRVTADGDIAIVADDGAELARIPAAALTSDAIVHERVAAPPVRSRHAPGPGRARSRGRRSGRPAGAGHGSRAPSSSRCSARPTSRAAARSTSSTTRPSRRTRSRGPGHGAVRDPDQGHDEGARGHDRRATRRSARSIPGSARR